MKSFSPGVIAAIVIGVIALGAVIYEVVSMRDAIGGPVVGSKDTMPEAMRRAYGGGGKPPGSAVKP